MKTKIVCAAAAALLAAGPALADSSASATLGPLTLTLIDLNPLDGVTPWVSFAGSSGSYTYANAYTSAPYGYDNTDNHGSGAWGSSASAATTSLAQASAAISGSGTLAGTTLAASGSAANPVSANPWDYAYFQGYAYGPDVGSQSFTLSANTLMVVQGAGSFVASTTGGYSLTYYYGEYVNASVSLQLSGPASSGGIGGYQNSYDQIGASFYSSAYWDGTGYVLTGASASDARTLGVSFLNLTGTEMTGTMSAQVNVWGQTYANPVPEPETWALMLAGLAAVGSLARRRRA